MGEEAEVGLGLLQLDVGQRGGVLGDGPVVRVRVEDSVAVGAGGARVGHADRPRGGAGRRAVVPEDANVRNRIVSCNYSASSLPIVPRARDGDGEGPHAAPLPGPRPRPARALLPGRRHEGRGRRELVFRGVRHQGLEVHPDTRAGEPQGAPAHTFTCYQKKLIIHAVNYLN